MEDRHIIWSNENLDLDDWREDLQEQYPDCSEDELYRIMCETNADYLSDERVNLNKEVDGVIVCFADLGLWDGHHQGARKNHGSLQAAGKRLAAVSAAAGRYSVYSGYSEYSLCLQ